MTDKPTPTDAELKALWRIHAADIGGSIYYARAVLAKWGQPAQPQAGAVPLDEARRLFDAGWKAAALFCDREDVVADGIIGFGACQQFEAAFSAAQPVAREPLTDEQTKALMQAHRTAMLMTCKARVPECGEFAAIAQDLDWLCESFGIKGGQHGTE